MAMTKQVFIETLGELAQHEALSRSKWVLPSICIAQAALETGWGKSKLMTKANAFFGIKAGSSWKGKVYNARTQECYDGKSYTTITDCFRAYDSLAESVKDYYDLICNSNRYAKAVNVADAKSCITAIRQGGYATSPTYITNVMNVVNSNSLTAYDGVVTGKSAESSNNATATQGKTVEEVAKEVLAGKWGNNPARRTSLIAAGYDYMAVQKKVNELAGCTTATKVTTYTVKRGDNLTKIARSYNTTVAAILKANKAKYPKITASFIMAGWVLNV